MANKKIKVMNNLTLRFIPYSEVEKLESNHRIKIILDVILKNKIVILQGKLDSIEESSLIQSTMALAGRVKDFKGVELAVINPGREVGVLSKMKFGIARALIGDRDSLTIIGPASIVKEIKRDPMKIEFLLNK